MLDKFLRNLGIKSENKNIVVFILVCAILLFLISCYNKYKMNTFDFMDGKATSPHMNKASDVRNSGVAKGFLEPLLRKSEDLEGSEVPSGTSTDTHGLPPAGSIEVDTVNPSELLPKNVASDWSDSHQDPSGILQNVNLLQAGDLLGIDTVGQTLRNANLQLRADPTIPKSHVGPWNNSTINETANVGINEC